MSKKQRTSAICGGTLVLLMVFIFSFFPAASVHAAGAPPAKPPLAPQPINLPSQPATSPGSFPVTESTVDGWVSNNDQSSIRQHGWALWQGITSITSGSQGWPVFDTWYTDTEVEAGRPTSPKAALFRATRAAGRPTHHFEGFEQFHHTKVSGGRAARLRAFVGAPAAGGLQVLGFNKFDTDYANFVWSNNYNTATGLWNLQNSWPVGTAAAQRAIKPFVNTAIGLKPVYQFVNGPKHSGGITVMPYWLGDLSTGPSNSSNSANPTPDTWNECVAVYSTASAPASQTIPNCANGKPASGFVSVKEFFNFALTSDEAKSACGGQPNCPIQAGDFAIMVAMHMTSRENANWTWQTYWWNYNQPFPYGAPPSSIPAPFNNYAMCTAYSMTNNPANSLTGQNVLCYNPYLETGLPGVVGTASNCMSCHTTAALGNNPNNPPVTNTSFVQSNPNYPSFLNMSAFIAPTDPNDANYYYACNTKTDFSWFLAALVANGTGAPTNITPCSNPAGSPPTSGKQHKAPAHKGGKKK